MDARVARRIAVVALGIGITADLLFDGFDLGVNVPLAAAAALIAITFLRAPGKSVDRLDAWIPIVTMLAAVGVALCTDPLVVLLDLGLVGCGLLAWALAVSVGGLTRRTTASLAWLATNAAMVVGLGSLVVLPAAAKEVALGETVQGARRTLPVIRGLLLALPVVALFTVLLGSADVAFRRLVEEALAFPIDLEDAGRRVVVVAMVAWAAGGGLLIAAAGLPWGLGAPRATRPAEHGRGVEAAGEITEPSAMPDAGAGSGAAGGALVVALAFATAGPSSTWARAASLRPALGPPLGRPLRQLIGATEMLTILVAVEVLFAGFVVVQVAYLFGGFATVTGFGITYSEYAREGFFQLVAVVAGAGVLLSLAAAVAGRSPWFAPIALGLVGLTTVILVSAATRLGLYQQAYGWTELRFYVAAAIAWLGICLSVALAVVLSRQVRWLVHGVAFAAIGVTLAVTAIGPQAFIASQNVARALDPSLVPPEGKAGLDAEYVSTLGAGAVPVLIEALPRLDPATRATVLRGLDRQRQRLDAVSESHAWPGWNLARERARLGLSTLPR